MSISSEISRIGSARDNIAQAIASKGVTVPSGSKIDDMAQLIMSIPTFTSLDAYPVGSIYLSVDSTDPGTIFGGTWIAFAAGRVLVGVDTNDADFDTVEETGGEKTHTLTVSEMPSHNHKLVYQSGKLPSGSQLSRPLSYNSSGDGYGYDSTYVGGNAAHNNLQPYITCYMWKRTA